MESAVTLRNSRTLYASDRLRLAEETFATPDGAVCRPAIHHPGAVAIIACPTLDHLLLVRQYRYPLRRWTVEIPAGTVNAGEDPLTTARRELTEETGWSATDWQECLRYVPAAGISDEVLTVFRAEGLRPGAAAPEQGELVSPVVWSRAELRQRLQDAGPVDAKTLIALAWLGWWPGDD